MSESPIVEIKNLNVAFGGNTALEGINLSIYPSEVIAVIGLNGAGKTTLLKTMLGIYKPSSGLVKLNAKKIGYVPQSLSFDRSIPLTVKELLRAYSSKKQSIREETRRKLNLVGALHLENKRVGDLSGGELQRVLLANALLSDPELLLLDEPTTGIDVVGEKGFLEIIKTLQDEQRMAIVLVSHDIHLVYRYATRIVCIHRKMMCQGPPHTIAENLDFVKLFGNYLTPYEHEHT
ncbi:MAG: metal ABC transporter ATP-binding protein [Actinomycetota bacterium]|nr:metal ABC transporter ATP-binding protein [Actinomycetota bacterium]